jgi:RNA polymerase sigma factor (sigma-70 family)
MASTLVDDPRDRLFERLYERYVRDVYRYVLSVVRNPAEAEDVTQTTFMNAYRAIQAGERPLKPQNWLISIAHNACRSRVRWTMRRPREVPLDDLAPVLAMPEADDSNVHEVLRAVGRLPSNQRAAITMRELEGRSYPEIAESLGVTVPAVEALISRARRSLKLQAAALRGLLVFQLPRSVRRLFDNGEVAAGGALGGGALAKTAAVLVAAAAGVGYVASDSHRSKPAPVRQPSPQLYAAVPVPAKAKAAKAAAATQVKTRRAAKTSSGSAAAGAPTHATPSPDPGTTTPPANSSPAASPQPQPAGPAAEPVRQAPAPVPLTSTVEAAPNVGETLPVPLPTPVPPVQLPPVPELPPTPTVPVQPPSLPLP